MLDKRDLLEFLNVVDERIEEAIELTAVGGTAMTLLGIKESTRDIDFNADGRSFEIFKEAIARIPHGHRIDLYSGGMVFSQQMPDDYVGKRLPIKSDFKKINFYALNPLDIVATKIGRLNERDIEDIRDCIDKYSIEKSEIEKRAGQTEYIGRRENYEANLRYVLGKFF
jgi:hypothetical protein